MEYTRATESPEAYHFWTAATILGAATARQVSLDFNYFTIFPNFYTILVGPSGVRKSAAAGIGMRLAEAAGIKKFSDKITGAALIKDLADCTVKRITGNVVQLCSPMLIYASELGVFMGPDAYSSGVVADLTDLYDCPKKWEKKTISRGTEEIIAPYISLFAASTPTSLKACIPPDAVGQGFTSRILFIWADKRKQRVPYPEFDVGTKMLEVNLVKDLQHISELRGTFSFTTRGFDTYRSHYLSRPDPEEEFEDERLRGYASRKDMHLLKLAMALSVADRDDLTISEKEIEAAIEAFRWLDEGLAHVFAGQGSSSQSLDVVRVYEQIQKASRGNGKISFGDLMKRNYTYMGHEGLANVLLTLVDSNAIKEETKNLGGTYTRWYRVTMDDFLKTGRSNLPHKLKGSQND
jgi:hypothetical protein